MTTDTNIRTTFRKVADAAEPPSIDRPSFDRRVRRYRNRRRAAVSMTAGAMALILAAVPFAVDRIGAGNESRPAPAEEGTVELTAPVYFAVQKGGWGHAMAVDPEGKVHDLGVRVEEI